MMGSPSEGAQVDGGIGLRPRKGISAATSTGPWIPSSLLLAFLLVPVGALVFRALTGQDLPRSLGGAVVGQALGLSLVTSVSSALLTLFFGTPLAYLLARRHFRGRQLVDTLVDMPLVLPPVVAGVALLMAFGRMGVVGRYLDMAGLRLGFGAVAVVMAQTFVSAPLYVRAARAGFASVDRRLESVSRTLGVTPFWTFIRVTLPLARPSLLAGLALAWARALGEFGATMMFAGNLAGRTRTLPLAILTSMEEDLDAALAISLLLLAFSFLVLALLRTAGPRDDGLNATD